MTLLSECGVLEYLAEHWVKRRMGERKVSKGYVCVYEFDEAALHNLKTLVFNAPTDEWVDFVMQNRTQKGFVHEYDLVYGQEALYQDFKAEIL